MSSEDSSTRILKLSTHDGHGWGWRRIILGVADHERAEQFPFFIQCGARLRVEDGFCSLCGTARWTPSEPVGSGGPAGPAGQAGPPGPAEPHPAPVQPPVPEAAAVPVSLGLLPWAYACGAVLALIWATQSLAMFLNPAGRAQLLQQITNQNVPDSSRPGLLVFWGAFSVGVPLAAAALHAISFYGLRRTARWGWLAAVIVAGLWSVILVGIPILRRLLSLEVRRTFGVA